MGGIASCSAALPSLKCDVRPGKGRAVFANAPINKDEVIAIWGGLIIPLDQALSLPRKDMTQCIQVEEEWVLWTGHHRQTTADWINHSCDPNSGLSGQITIVAMRDIMPGEEITFDYAMSNTSDLDNFECLCGAAQCRGFVGRDDWRDQALQERYKGYFSPFIARRIAGERQAMSRRAG